jgi:hypothetical protein
MTSGAFISVLDDWCLSYPGLWLYDPGRRHVPAGLHSLISLIREMDGMPPAVAKGTGMQNPHGV